MTLFPLFHYCNVRFTENMHLVPGPVEKVSTIYFSEGGTVASPAPWEKRIDNGYPNVFYDVDFHEYRCYYTCFIRDDSHTQTPVSDRKHAFYLESSDRVAGILLATSTDGTNWARPDLGIVEHDGSKHNNILLTHVHGAGVFRDAHAQDPTKRYKMIVRNDATGKMAVSFSADGIHWCPPIDWPEYNPAGDTHNNAWWDSRIQKYVLITRIWRDSLRIAARCESDDFIHWSEPVEIYRGDGVDDQIYSMPVFQKNDLYIGLASFFHGGDRNHESFDCVDCELLYSTDTRHWNRLCRNHPLIPRNKGRYGDHVPDCCCIYASRPIQRDGKYEIFYFGGNGQHTGFRETSLMSASIDADMLAGYAPNTASGGSLFTQRIRFTGDNLYIKAALDTDASLLAAVTAPIRLHQKASVLTDYTFNDCVCTHIEKHLYHVKFSQPLSRLNDSIGYYLQLQVTGGTIFAIGGDFQYV